MPKQHTDAPRDDELKTLVLLFSKTDWLKRDDYRYGEP